jgi:hypothetical protein
MALDRPTGRPALGNTGERVLISARNRDADTVAFAQQNGCRVKADRDLRNLIGDHRGRVFRQVRMVRAEHRVRGGIIGYRAMERAQVALGYVEHATGRVNVF